MALSDRKKKVKERVDGSALIGGRNYEDLDTDTQDKIDQLVDHIDEATEKAKIALKESIDTTAKK